MQRIFQITLPTVNRGKQLFLVSVDPKGKFFAHEIGSKTQFAEVFNKQEFRAHRLNPTKRRGNQYGRFYKPVGMHSIIAAKKLIYDRAKTHVQYC